MALFNLDQIRQAETCGRLPPLGWAGASFFVEVRLGWPGATTRSHGRLAEMSGLGGRLLSWLAQKYIVEALSSMSTL